jgi:large subunit ribosomal protein L29
MKFEELTKKTPADLRKELDTAEFDLMRLGGMVQTGGVGKDSGKIKELKKTIARIKTLQQRVEAKGGKSNK